MPKIFTAVPPGCDHWPVAALPALVAAYGAAEALKEIHIGLGRPTIPVSMILKQKGLPSKRNSPRTVSAIVLGCNRAGSNKALEFPQRRLDRFPARPPAPAAPCRQDQWQPDQVDLCLFSRPGNGRLW